MAHGYHNGMRAKPLTKNEADYLDTFSNILSGVVSGFEPGKTDKKTIKVYNDAAAEQMKEGRFNKQLGIPTAGANRVKVANPKSFNAKFNKDSNFMRDRVKSVVKADHDKQANWANESTVDAAHKNITPGIIGEENFSELVKDVIAGEAIADTNEDVPDSDDLKEHEKIVMHDYYNNLQNEVDSWKTPDGKGWSKSAPEYLYRGEPYEDTKDDNNVNARENATDLLSIGIKNESPHNATNDNGITFLSDDPNVAAAYARVSDSRFDRTREGNNNFADFQAPTNIGGQVIKVRTRALDPSKLLPDMSSTANEAGAGNQLVYMGYIPQGMHIENTALGDKEMPTLQISSHNSDRRIKNVLADTMKGHRYG